MGALQSIGTINFEVYESGKNRLLGLASVELPNFEYESVDMKGNGIAGTTSAPICGNFGDLELKLTWRNTEGATTKLLRHDKIDLSLYAAISKADSGTGSLSVVQHKIETRVWPKSLNLGKLEPSATADGETTFTVVTFNYKIDNKETMHFDRFNYILRVDGTDYSAVVRRTLGL